MSSTMQYVLQSEKKRADKSVLAVRSSEHLLFPSTSSAKKAKHQVTVSTLAISTLEKWSGMEPQSGRL